MGDDIKIKDPGIGNSSIEVDINDTFFPVEMRRLYWQDEVFFSKENPLKECLDWVAIVDMEHKYVFTTATIKYVIYQNRRAYDFGVRICQSVLHEQDEDNIVDVMTRMNLKRSVVEYSLSTKMHVNQPQINDGWIPVITIINSYNKTRPLTCIMGFRNTKYSLSVLFPEFSMKAKSTHDVNPSVMEQEILKQIRDKGHLIEEFIDEFDQMLEKLRNSPISETDFLPLFCKIQKIKRKTNLPEMQLKHLISILSFVKERINLYCAKYKYNAYSLLLVVADYIENLDQTHRKMISQDQIALGKWVEEYLEVSSKQDYSPYDYIGKDAYDAASWFGMLKANL